MMKSKESNKQEMIHDANNFAYHKLLIVQPAVLEGKHYILQEESYFIVRGGFLLHCVHFQERLQTTISWKLQKCTNLVVASFDVAKSLLLSNT